MTERKRNTSAGGVFHFLLIFLSPVLFLIPSCPFLLPRLSLCYTFFRMQRASDDQNMADLHKAELLKLEGRHADALVILEKLLSVDPDNPLILEEIADNELSLEQYDRARTAALSAAALDPESYTAYYILGFIASHREQWADSLEYLKKANGLKPNNPEILRCFGWSLFNDGQMTSGTVTLERALNLDSDNTLTLCDLGVVYVQSQNFAKARALFQRAADIDPTNTRALECLQMVGRIQMQTGELKGQN